MAYPLPPNEILLRAINLELSELGYKTILLNNFIRVVLEGVRDEGYSIAQGDDDGNSVILKYQDALVGIGREGTIPMLRSEFCERRKEYNSGGNVMHTFSWDLNDPESFDKLVEFLEQGRSG